MRLYPDHYLQISDLKIYNKNVKDDLKIVSLGDLHISRLVDSKKLDPIKHQLEKEKANYHVFLGDIIDTPMELKNSQKRKEVLDLFKTSAAIAPTMVILGNHDYIIENETCNYIYYNYDFWDKVENLNNVHLLVNRYYQDSNIFFMGYIQTLDYYYNINNKHHENLEKFYKDFKQHTNLYQNLPTDIPKIGLIHSPEYANLEKNAELLKEYDLLIGGHEHDGCMPFGLGYGNRGIISPKKTIFPNNVRGFRALSTGTSLLISGGIVKIQDCAPNILHPLNHLCPMQMDTITFTNEENKEKISKRLIYTMK